MDALIRHLRYAGRSLGKDKAFAATTMLTLAVCIGANTSIFTVVRSILLQPLPVFEADDIVLMSNRYPKAGVGESNNSGAADYYDRLRDVTALPDQAMFNFGNQTVDIGGSPAQVTAMNATPSLFRLLRTAPAAGRTFSDDEGEIGAERKVILSHGLWHQLYGGDRAVVGKELRLSGRSYSIVGVMPRDFVFVNPEVRLWLPLAFTAEQKQGRHSNNWYHVGRLKPGATLQQAQAQVDALNAANLERFPQWKELLINAGFHTKAERLQDHLVKDVKGALYLLWGGAVLVLLIGAVNLANLVLARLNMRRKELATRLALGASRAQIAAGVVIEQVMAALVGGAMGLALGAAILRALATAGLERLPRGGEIRIDAAVILFALGMSAVAGVLIGVIPLAHVFKVSLASVLHEESRTGTGGRRARLVRQGLVLVQVGFAFVLLTGAGLLLASFRQLLNVDPGYASAGVLTASTTAPRYRYADSPELRTLMNRLLEAIRRIPGVAAAGATTTIPLGGNYSDSVILAEGHDMKPGESLISPHQLAVTPGYFETMRIPLARGRYFEEKDNEISPAVIIIDERLAQRFWPDRDPIGRRMYQPSDARDLLKTDERTRWLTVVGVVRAVRLENLEGTGNPVGAYYFPYAQAARRGYTFAIRAGGDLSGVARAVRAQVAGVDPELALFEVRTMTERAELSLASRKTSMTLAAGFGGVALFLSALGVYGVLAYLVTQRGREIGIRLALGSTAEGIFRLMLREGVVLVGGGLVLGLIGVLTLRTVVESQVYGVRPLDPLVLGVATALLACVALAACVLPARRAMRVDPARVL